MPGADLEKKDGQPGAEDKDPKDKDQVDPDKKADGKEDDLGEFADPQKALAEIKSLRAENAKHRTKNKSLEDQMKSLNEKFGGLKKALGVEEENDDPETKIKSLQEKNEALELELSMSQIVREHSIPKEHENYFRFLMAQKFGELEDGQELSDEAIQGIASEVLKLAGTGKQNSTGLDGSGKKPEPTNGDATTVDQFVKMNTGERSALYAKNPSLYDQLFKEAKDKKLI